MKQLLGIGTKIQVGKDLVYRVTAITKDGVVLEGNGSLLRLSLNEIARYITRK